MSALDIRPHSRRITGLAVAGLVLLGGGAFGLGLAHQLQPAGPSPFPPPQQPTLQIAIAAPTPQLQASTAVPTPVRHTHADEPAIDTAPAPDASSTLGDDAHAPLAAQTATAADVSATVPDPAPPAPESQPAPQADSNAAPQA